MLIPTSLTKKEARIPSRSAGQECVISLAWLRVYLLVYARLSTGHYTTGSFEDYDAQDRAGSYGNRGCIRGRPEHMTWCSGCEVCIEGGVNRIGCMHTTFTFGGVSNMNLKIFWGRQAWEKALVLYCLVGSRDRDTLWQVPENCCGMICYVLRFHFGTPQAMLHSHMSWISSHLNSCTKGVHLPSLSREMQTRKSLAHVSYETLLLI